MGHEWQYQLRIDLADAFADIARRDQENPAIAQLGSPELFRAKHKRFERLGSGEPS